MRSKSKKEISGLMSRGSIFAGVMIGVAALGMILAVGTPQTVQLLRRFQSKDAVQIVTGVLRKARTMAVQEKNEYVVFFDLENSQLSILDDDGGGGGNPANGSFDPTNRGNREKDKDERLLGPFKLPDGQVFGFIGGTVGPNGSYVTSPVTFSGFPPHVVFFSDGSVNEEGVVLVMPEVEYREQKRGKDKMMLVSRYTGSIVIRDPGYFKVGGRVE
ncbi:MAG: hypothetical protein U5O15_02830 [Candidatus Krumholzibacteriota bacterium]|nr:hypothetical protein [Candidatus Krumholzibacteriota bacterium]